MNGNSFTAGELRKALESLPDDLEVRIKGDGYASDGVVADAYRVTRTIPAGVAHDLPKENILEDGSAREDYFAIEVIISEE